MATVEVRDVYKSFGHVEVIHGVSVAIEDGEFVVLLGPSGCGKTTLLRMIAGLEKITGGEIAIGGRVVNNVPPKERDVAMVFQNYALYPHMTVFDNMAFSLKLRHAEKSTIDERVMRIAESLELTEYIKRYPRQLSGGQRQRVAMGRAIVRDPQVFLFDEPLSNLDAQLRVQMRTEIKALHQRLDSTSVYVTHDQVEAMTMADRMVVLNEGLVEQVGEPLEIYDRPRNMFVAGHIGSPAMNFLEGTVQRHDGGMGVTLANGTVLPAKRAVAARAEFGAVEHDAPPARRLDAQHQLGQRRLARARFANDGDALARRHREVDAVERPHHLLADRIVLGEVLDLENSPAHAPPRCLWRRLARRRDTIVSPARTGNRGGGRAGEAHG